MKSWERDYERTLKIRRDFEVKAEAIRKSDDLTPFGKDKALKVLVAELNMRLKKINPSTK